jgi:hypothetical protein
MEDIDDTNGWITVTRKNSCKSIITPSVMTNTNNAFTILSVSKDPTMTNMVPESAISNTNKSYLATDNKTIMHDPQEHCRQRKAARQ